MSDIPETIPPNGPLGYTCTETRNGPPLNYVGDKLRYSLFSLHTANQQIQNYFPNDLPSPFEDRYPQLNPKDLVLESIWASFRYALTSYVALYNMVAIVHDQGIFSKLLDMTHDTFKSWLENLSLEGSVI
jgi:hypothetical protein